MENSSIFMINMIVIAVFAICVITGWVKGFLWKLVSLLGFFVISILSWWLSSPLSELLQIYPKEHTPLLGTPLESMLYQILNRMSVFLLLFLLLFVVALVLRPLVKILQNIPVLSTINKILGAVVGGVQAIFLFCILTFILRLPIWQNGAQMVEQSVLKYSDTILSAMVFHTQDFWEELDAWNKRIQEGEGVTPTETQELQEWFEEHIQIIEKEDLGIQ